MSLNRALGVALLIGVVSTFPGCSDDDNGEGADAGPVLLDATSPLPGCSPACGSGLVCSAGTCTKPGPSKSCGTGPYGAGLPQGFVIKYVDASHTGQSDGTVGKPFTTIAAAVAAIDASPPPAAGSGYAIAVAAGSYDEKLTISRSMELHCRCPDKVRIGGPIVVSAVKASPTVVVDGCTVAKQGVPPQPASWGACSSLKACQDNKACTAPETCDKASSRCVHPQDGQDRAITANAVAAMDLTLVVRDSVIRGWCVGVYFNADSSTGSTSSLCVSRSTLLANNRGIDVVNAPPYNLAPGGDCGAAKEGVAATLSHLDQNQYAGVFTRSAARGVALTSNLITRTGKLVAASGVKTTAVGGFGVYLGDTSSTRVHYNVISDSEGTGLAMINATTPVKSTFEIRNNVLSNNKVAGISLQNLQADRPVKITDNTIDKTLTASGTPGGDGIQVAVAKGKSYAVDVVGNTIAGSARHGVILDGVSGSVINNTISSSGSYAVFLQKTGKVDVGGNSYSGNGKGGVTSVTNPSELIGGHPIPIP